MSARQPPPPPLSLALSRPQGTGREIDTKIGGEAGMAGVGRRGFAAVARAAMVAASLSPVHQPPSDAHRANVPQYLDSSATFGHVMRGKFSFDPSAMRLTIPRSRHDSAFVSEFGSDTFSSLSFSRITGLSRK